MKSRSRSIRMYLQKNLKYCGCCYMLFSILMKLNIQFFFYFHLLNQVEKWKTFLLWWILMVSLFCVLAFLNAPIFLNCFCPVSSGLVLGRNTTLAKAQRSSTFFSVFFLFQEMVSELCSGPCIAMEIRQLDPSKVFRDFCGPSDPVSTFLSDK